MMFWQGKHVTELSPDEHAAMIAWLKAQPFFMTPVRPLATRMQIMEVLRDWADQDLRARGVRYAGNPVVELPKDRGYGAEINLERLAQRIENAIKDGKIKWPGGVA